MNKNKNKKNKEFNPNTVHIVDSTIINKESENKTSVYELSCGHIFNEKICVGDKCPKCKKEIVLSDRERRKLILRIVLSGLIAFAIVLAIILCRPVSFEYITHGLSNNVAEDQREQIEGFSSINYHSTGYTWLKATLEGKFAPYNTDEFSLYSGAAQGFYDEQGNLLFYITTSDDLGGLIAFTSAEDQNHATLYTVF